MHQRESQSETRRTIVTVGEALIDLIAPPTSDWEQIEDFVPRIGGAPANMAVAIARLGGDAAFLGRISSDEPGKWIWERLVREGVTILPATPFVDAQTRLAVVTGPADARDFVFYGSPPADSLLSPDDVQLAHIERASAVLVSSLALTAEPSRRAMQSILDICRTAGVPLVFDPNPRRKTWPDPSDARARMMPFLREATILKMSTGELNVLGMTVEDVLALRDHKGIFVLTDGSGGCRYWYGDERAIAVPSFAIDEVDATGAGDAFTAALAMKFVAGKTTLTENDVRFACAVGALTATQLGAMDALPNRSTVERLFDSRPTHESTT